jgi:hypothetical protein
VVFLSVGECKQLTFVPLTTATTASLAGRFICFVGVLTARQIDDFSADLGSDFFQFRFADAATVDLKIGALDGHNGKTGTARPFAHVAPVAYKYLAHDKLLSKTPSAALNENPKRVLLGDYYPCEGSEPSQGFQQFRVIGLLEYNCQYISI